MGFYKKTILLSNQGDYGRGMVLLTIEKNSVGVFGNLKGFDVPDLTNLMLGISVNGRQVYKQPIFFSSENKCNFKLDNDFNIDGKIGCVIVCVSGDKVEALLWGTNSGQAQYKEDIIKNFRKEIEKPVMNDMSKTKVAEVRIEEIEKSNEEEMDSSLFESTEEEIEEIIDRNLGGEFYEMIHEQIEELFNKFPRDEDLQRLIPNSKWVKVDYENNGKDYVFGLLFDNEKVNYICYGVPGSSENLPPEEIRKYSQWMPINDENNTGYWLMYQSADSGESVNFEDVKLS